MKFKKLIALATTTVLSASLLVGCSSKKTETEGAKTDEPMTIAMITDVAGVNDQSFNQSAWEGLQKAEKELGVKEMMVEGILAIQSGVNPRIIEEKLLTYLDPNDRLEYLTSNSESAEGVTE